MSLGGRWGVPEVRSGRRRRTRRLRRPRHRRSRRPRRRSPRPRSPAPERPASEAAPASAEQAAEHEAGDQPAELRAVPAAALPRPPAHVVVRRVHRSRGVLLRRPRRLHRTCGVGGGEVDRVVERSLGLGQPCPRGGADGAASHGDEVPRLADPRPRVPQGVVERTLGPLALLLLAAGGGQRGVDGRVRLRQAVDRRDRVPRVDPLPEHRVGLRRRCGEGRVARSHRARRGDVALEVRAHRLRAGGGLGEGRLRGGRTAGQLLHLRQGVLRVPHGDDGLALVTGGDRGRGGPGPLGRVVEDLLRLVDVVRHRGQGPAGVRPAHPVERRPRGGEVRGSGGHRGVERPCRVLDPVLERSEAVEGLGLLVDRRVRLLADRDDLVRPLGALLWGVGDLVVELLLVREGLADGSLRGVDGLGEGLRGVVAELRGGEPDLLLGGLELVVDGDEGTARGPLESRERLLLRPRGRCRPALVPCSDDEQQDEQADHDDGERDPQPGQVRRRLAGDQAVRERDRRARPVPVPQLGDRVLLVGVLDVRRGQHALGRLLDVRDPVVDRDRQHDAVRADLVPLDDRIAPGGVVGRVRERGDVDDVELRPRLVVQVLDRPLDLRPLPARQRAGVVDHVRSGEVHRLGGVRGGLGNEHGADDEADGHQCRAEPRAEASAPPLSPDGVRSV